MDGRGVAERSREPLSEGTAATEEHGSDALRVEAREIARVGDEAARRRRLARTRSSPCSVALVSVPLSSRAQLRWKSTSAAAVSAPKMPSMRPGLKPSWARSTCSSATSSPRRFGLVRYSSRWPSRQPASSKRPKVVASTSPVIGRPRER